MFTVTKINVLNLSDASVYRVLYIALVWAYIMDVISIFILVQMGGRNTVLLDAISCRIPLVSDIPTIIFGADVTHPENGEDSSPSIAAVVSRVMLSYIMTARSIKELLC